MPEADLFIGACDLIAEASLQSLFKRWRELQSSSSTDEDLLEAADYKAIWSRARGLPDESRVSGKSAGGSAAATLDTDHEVAEALMGAYAEAEDRCVEHYESGEAPDDGCLATGGGDEFISQLNESVPGVFANWLIEVGAKTAAARAFNFEMDD
eukprot:TRINITY_DN1646_c0_g1_i10.p2 TRINITY_DN1646_c0_g1~~TRINITY_DN1646_c0_g1_i10.p2  ORF type:complete len:154 (-),score=17.69 TRINITY_DN1646_c0_g1_i10:503-964(-)